MKVLSDWAVPQVPTVDRNLVFGEVLFGVGWGLTGFCPGPLLVGVAGSPQLTSVIVFAALGAGVLMASTTKTLLAPAMV